MEVGIVAQRGNSRAATLAAEIRTALRADGIDCRLDAATASEVAPDAAADVERFAEYDLVVSIGGDGTFLFAARGAGGTPILGVNLGEVGFLNAVTPDDAVEAVREEVDSLRNDSQEIREAPRLTASDGEWESVPAVNEIVVTGPRRGHGGGATFEVEIDGSPYTGGHADGILIATPTGSSAYNLSEDGPLVHPSINGLIINEMCGREAMPPLVVAGDCEVSISVSDADHVVVVSDGRRPHELDVPCEISVSRSEPPVRLAGPVADFFEALGKLS